MAIFQLLEVITLLMMSLSFSQSNPSLRYLLWHSTNFDFLSEMSPEELFLRQTSSCVLIVTIPILISLLFGEGNPLTHAWSVGTRGKG